MRWPARKPLFAALVLAAAESPAQPETSSEPCAARPAYALVRYEEDWSLLADARCATDWLDRLKYIGLGQARSLGLGGDARIRYEYFDNPGFGSGVQDDDGYLLQRYLLHADLRLTDELRFFGQLESSWEDGRRGGPRPTDRNRLDFNQFFAQVTLLQQDRGLLLLRMGRQEVELGSAQFTSVRDGLNDRLSFDGVRVLGEIRGWRLHAMATRVVPTVPGTFDDSSGSDQTMSGFFVARSHTLLPGGNAVVYANRRTRPTTSYADGSGEEERITTGTRWWGRGRSWDYNLEAGIQRGSIGDEDIRVWYVNTDNGWTLGDAPGRPRFGVRFSIGSGDQQLGDGVIGTFSPLFASTAYSGLSGLLGPSNSINLAPSVAVRLSDTLLLTAGTSIFWRQSLSDGIYNINSEVLRLPGSSDARHVGSQPTVQLNWTPTRHVTTVVTLSYFRAGEFLRETPPGEDVTYFTAWWAYRF
jgi:hypothetical protein